LSRSQIWLADRHFWYNMRKMGGKKKKKKKKKEKKKKKKTKKNCEQ